MALGSTQPLTEMSTRNLPGAKGWLARKAGASTSHNPISLDGLLQRYLYFYLYQNIEFGLRRISFS
jgi:hypothetical protein